jgi:uncharacterized SAM-binding protein YcdF (DUF218 family)
VSLGFLSTALLIPPVNLAPAGIAGLLLSRRWPRFGRFVMAAALILLFLFSLPVVSGTLLAGLELGLPLDPPPDPPPQAIVILSADPAYGAEAGGILPGKGIGELTLDRMRAGAVLHRRTNLPVLVTGGPLETGAMPIAVQMAHALTDEFGTPVAFVEPESADTWENAQDSAALLRPAGITRVYVVTHAWHMRRALMAFSAAGLTPVPAPLRFERWPRFELNSFLPRASSLINSYYAVHEWIGCAWYALRK